MTDKEFDFRIKLILKGEKDGLKLIYQEYGKLIYTQMINLVKSPQDAEDLTSDFFLKLWQTADRYKSGNGHKRYLTVIARNMALDFMKKRNREIYSIDDENTGHNEPCDDNLTDEKIVGEISFDNALEILNCSEREIIHLHIGMELTFREISNILQKPLGTVTWKYSRAIAKLKNNVKEGQYNG